MVKAGIHSMYTSGDYCAPNTGRVGKEMRMENTLTTAKAAKTETHMDFQMMFPYETPRKNILAHSRDRITHGLHLASQNGVKISMK